MARNPVTVNGIVRLGEVFTDPGEALNAENVTFWQDGVEIPATMVPTEMLTPDKVAVLDEDGTMHILLTTELTGDKGVIENLRTEVAEVDSLGVTELGKAAGLLPVTIMGRVQAAVDRLKSYEKTKDYNWIEKFWATLCGESTNKDVLNQSMLLDFDPGTLASLTAYVSEVITAIENGDAIAQEDYDNLLEIVEFLNALELAGVGENVTAGIGEAMAAAGWETDAESVASNLENALKSALVIQSPSQRMHPVGENVAAGIGEGAAGFDFSADGTTIAGAIESAITAAITANPLIAAGTTAMIGLASGMTSYSWSGIMGTVSFGIRSAASTAISASTLRSVGINAMNGLAAGIRAGQSSVVSAMRSAAQSAVAAAKNTLKIRSPSRVFRDEIGAMTMRGFGQGVLAESKAQARIIRNAARYLTDEAREGAIIGGSTTNNRTYDQSSTITLTGNTFSIRDEQDIYALATEIAALTKRQQRGKGLRMA